MPYFSPFEASLPKVEEVIPVGNSLRVVIRQGAHRFILDGVIDFYLNVGDDVERLPKYRTRIELRPRWSPFDKAGMDDD